MDLHIEKVGETDIFSKPRWSSFKRAPPMGAVSKPPFLVYRVLALVYISKYFFDILYRCAAWRNICYIVNWGLKAKAQEHLINAHMYGVPDRSACVGVSPLYSKKPEGRGINTKKKKKTTTTTTTKPKLNYFFYTTLGNNFPYLKDHVVSISDSENQI